MLSKKIGTLFTFLDSALLLQLLNGLYGKGGDGMSILINGAKLPKSCFGCHLFKLDDKDLWCIANHYAGYCRVLSKYIDENKFVNERHPNCPLIEVKTPHGRLGDLDKLWDRMYNYIDNEGAKMPFGDNDFMIHRDSACELIEDAPTVIEAEGSEE